MRDIPRVAFLVIVDVSAVALLVLLINGCVSTPAEVALAFSSRM